MKAVLPEQFEGVWSATPTPLTDEFQLDEAGVHNLVTHHLRLGISGLFLAGTCGEGPWLPDRQRRLLTQLVVHELEELGARLPVSVQVTDNSAARILDKIEQAHEDGADLVVIAPPHFLFNATPENLRILYLEAIRKSTLPVVLYHFGQNGNTPMPEEVLKVLLEEENVVAIKDSSADVRYREIALAARQNRPNLRLQNGDEFNCAAYLEAGFDGLLLGGGIFNGHLAHLIMEAVAKGDLAQAQVLQERMNRLMYAVYGGEKIESWLAGAKYLLLKMGVFHSYANFPRYELTESCRTAVERILVEENAVLLPSARA